ncbi:hypothetical protein [Tepidimicrobium xylanilyticum]
MSVVTKGQVRIAGTSLPFTDEPLTNCGNKIYQIIDTEKRVWDMSVPIIVTTIDGVTVIETYDIDYANGYIIFHEAKDRGELFVSGNYLPTTVVGEVLGYSIDKNRNFIEYTPLGSHITKNAPAGLAVTGTIETLAIKDTYFLDILESAEKVLLDFQMGEDRVESYWVYLENISTSHNAGDLVRRNVSFRNAEI